MLKKTLFTFGACLACAAALAANSADDKFLEQVRAIQYHAHGNQVEYRSAAQKLIFTVNQSDGPQLAALGRAFMRMQDYETASAVLVSTVRIAPSNADAQGDLAFVTAMLGRDCATSRTAYNQAISLNPALAEMPHVRNAHAKCPPL